MKRKLLPIAFLMGSAPVFAQTPRMVFVEEFTQASCGPCAQANPSFTKLLTDNASKVNFIKYQTSWPGTDPMNKQNPTDVATRVTYTGAGSVGVPYAVMDGAVVKGGGYDGAPGGLTQAKITAEAAITSPFEMKLYHQFNAANDSIFITVKVTCTQASTMTTPKLQVSMMEKMITFTTAPGSNGEKAFEHVMRKMYPSASGTAMATTWTVGQTQTFTFKGAIPTYIYKKTEIATIAWIQDDKDKNVKQSVFNPTANSIPTGIADVAASINLNAYPNPSNGLMNVYFESASSANYNVRITNAIGQVVYEETLSNFNGIYSKELDLTKYGKGVYVLSVANSAVQQVQKLVVY
jgi:hypothetical protein